jgi:glyoxylase-like metal-dependent hydrolase (beta-lactamase superfamily II)
MGDLMTRSLFRFAVGRIRCIAIKDADEGNRNVLLVDTGERRALIEAGNGDALAPYGQLQERLREAGVSPAEIDLVILTHADVDHIGGVADATGALAFPHARVVLSREEWEYWSSRPARMPPNRFVDEPTRLLVDQFPPARLEQLRDVLQLVEPGDAIAPGIRALAAAGHTPGHLAVAVESGDERLFFVGDMAYDPITTEELEQIYSVFDVNPARAAATRARLFEQAAAEGTLLMGYHFMPFPGLGHVMQDGSGLRWQPLKEE